jgi:hypothetical protein
MMADIDDRSGALVLLHLASLRRGAYLIYEGNGFNVKYRETRKRKSSN